MVDNIRSHATRGTDRRFRKFLEWVLRFFVLLTMILDLLRKLLEILRDF
jgi:hypothetical protein